MPLHVFDILRTDKPTFRHDFDALESAVESMLRDDPAGVVDDRVIVQTAQIEKRFVQATLVDLVKRGYLEVRVFWNCPNGQGVAREAAHVKEFPDSIICSQCGKEHWLSQHDVEIHFIATQRLLGELKLKR